MSQENKSNAIKTIQNCMPASLRSSVAVSRETPLSVLLEMCVDASKIARKERGASDDRLEKAEGAVKNIGEDKDWEFATKKDSDCESDSDGTPYKQCRDCDYCWATKSVWEMGQGRVAFNKDEKADVIVCCMCEKGVEDYCPSDSEDEEE
jgi:hypothetical protein